MRASFSNHFSDVFRGNLHLDHVSMPSLDFRNAHVLWPVDERPHDQFNQ